MLFAGLRLPLGAFGLTCFLTCFLAGCVGAVGSPAAKPDSDLQGGTGTDDRGTENVSGNAPGRPDPEAPGQAGVAFRAPSDSLQLLPFEARLTKLANVVGVPTDNAIFSELRAQQRELGAYDYAQGIAPDLTWSAKRIAGWMQALRPVCDAPAMKNRYPTISGELDELVMRAHGRRANADDRNDLASVPTSLDASARHRATCMGFLSSAEFLAP